jgi:hypothetical protein
METNPVHAISTIMLDPQLVIVSKMVSAHKSF